MFPAIDWNTPSRGNVLFGGVCIVEDDRLWLDEGGIGIEDGAVSRNRDSVGGVVTGCVSKVPIVVGPNKGDRFDPLASSLRSHLMRELMVGCAICDALLQCRSSPLRNKQRRQRLASSRGEFEGNIRAVGVVGRVTSQ